MKTSDAHPPQPERQPVPAELHEPLVEPMITAVGTVMRELLNTEAAVQAAWRQTLQGPLGELAAVIKFAAATEGALVLSCSRPTAALLAGRMLTAVRQDPDQPLVEDSLGEIANVIAGLVKTLLFGTPYHFTLSTPTIGGGDTELWPPPGRDGVMISFTTDAGEVVLHFFP